jgi:hypothetical protein
MKIIVLENMFSNKIALLTPVAQHNIINNALGVLNVKLP